MKNIWIVSLGTIREAFARKVFIFFLIVTVMVLLIMIGTYSVLNVDMLIGSINKTVNSGSVKEIISSLEFLVISPLAGLCILLSIFASSSFIPTMLEKGNIDLLLSKPLSRDQLIIGKFLGGVLVVFINILLLILGVWLIISLKFSYWDFSFLLSAIIITFSFAVLYSIIILFGVMTKSSIPGMMIAYFVLIVLSPLLLAGRTQFKPMIENEIARTAIDVLYYFIPKISELMGNILYEVSTGQGILNYQPVLTSFLFLILMLGFTIYLFRKKDF